jgi:hypothetical protein
VCATGGCCALSPLFFDPKGRPRFFAQVVDGELVSSVFLPPPDADAFFFASAVSAAEVFFPAALASDAVTKSVTHRRHPRLA